MHMHNNNSICESKKPLMSLKRVTKSFTISQYQAQITYMLLMSFEVTIFPDIQLNCSWRFFVNLQHQYISCFTLRCFIQFPLFWQLTVDFLLNTKIASCSISYHMVMVQVDICYLRLWQSPVSPCFIPAGQFCLNALQ